MGNLNILSIDELSSLNVEGNSTITNLHCSAITTSSLIVNGNISAGTMNLGGLLNVYDKISAANLSISSTIRANDYVLVGNTVPSISNELVCKNYVDGISYITPGNGIDKTVKRRNNGEWVGKHLCYIFSKSFAIWSSSLLFLIKA